jgi:peptidoglycan/xylan/chitin deacetylase (PgdA/CDA1 family)
MTSIRQKISYRLAMHVHTATWRARDMGSTVSFTFDDAPVSAATHGAAILEDLGVRGTFYLCGGLLGRQGDVEPIMDLSQAEKLAESGHEIGCHTYAHSDVRSHRWPILERDLGRNSEILAVMNGGVSPRNFSYPFGGISFRSKLRLQRRFDTCRGIYAGINLRKIDAGHLKAVPLYSSAIDLAGAIQWIEKSAAESGWLIFFTHDIGDNPSQYGATYDLLRGAVRAATAAGSICAPVGAAVDRLRPIQAGSGLFRRAPPS